MTEQKKNEDTSPAADAGETGKAQWVPCCKGKDQLMNHRPIICNWNNEKSVCDSEEIIMAEINSCLYATSLAELIVLEAAVAAKCKSCSDPGSVEELVAVGAASSANCRPCLEHHSQQALELGVSREDVQMAVATALAAGGRGGA